MIVAISRIEEDDPRSRRWPSSACVSTIARSSGVSGPGFSRIASGIATLPTSCSGAAWLSCSQNSGSMPICSASSVERRPMRSMCAPVSSSRNSTAIERRRTVSVCAISSSESARLSSCERPWISSSSAVRRLSPKRHPSTIAETARTAMQAIWTDEELASTVPRAAATATSASGAHTSPLVRRGSSSGGIRPDPGSADWRATRPSLPPGSPDKLDSSPVPRASLWRVLDARCGRVEAAPRCAGRRKLTWVTPLTGGQRPNWDGQVLCKQAVGCDRGALDGLIGGWTNIRAWAAPRALLPGFLQLRDVDRVRRRRQRDSAVPPIEGDLAATRATLDDLDRVGLAGRGDVQRPAFALVADADDLPPGDRRGPDLRQRTVIAERLVDELAQVRQPAERGEVGAARGGLQPLALEQLRRRTAADVLVELRAALDVDRVADLDQLERQPALGEFAPTALARQQVHVERDRRAARDDRPGDVHRGRGVGGGFRGGQDLGRGFVLHAVAGRG